MNNVSNHFAQKNDMILKGQIVQATEMYFAPNARTVDFDGTVTKNKEEMMAKMKGFVDAIKKVNGITMHGAGQHEDVSFAEFTFDFEMKDGSNILWHEIIRSRWNDGHIIEEQYFKA